jgi:DNA polymerase-4
VYAETLRLYRALKLDRPRIRLVGVKAENLRPTGQATQLALDFSGGSAGPAAPARTADRAIDALVAKFGASVVRPTSLLSPRVVPSAGGLNRAKPQAENSPDPHQITNRRNLPGNPST